MRISLEKNCAEWGARLHLHPHRMDQLCTSTNQTPENKKAGIASRPFIRYASFT
jgi:hypothetical protein